MQPSKELKQFDLAEKTAKVKILTGQVAQNIMEIGKTLLEVQENLPRGEFSNWLENEINYSKRTAYNFMKVAREFADVQPVAQLGIRKLLALTGIEEEEREKVINDYDLETMTAKQVEEIVKEEKIIKEVNEFMEKLSHKFPPHEININNDIYADLTYEEAMKLEQGAVNGHQAFEDIRAMEYQELLDIKDIFKDDKKFAKFVIQTGLKEAIEEFVFQRELPDKLFAVWEAIEKNLQNKRR